MSETQPDQKLILLDTNVWIDYFVPSRPGFDIATKLVYAIAESKCELAYSAHSLADLAYIVRQSQKADLRSAKAEITDATALAIAEYTWGCVDAMDLLATAVPFDTRTVWLAQKLKHTNLDFEDCLVLAACQLANVRYLVTSDSQLRDKAPLAALSPNDMLSYLESGAA